MDETALRQLIEEAAIDDTGLRVRSDVCRRLAKTFREAGKMLWVGGSLIGPDRPEGRSPFGHGSDATVGLATVVQVGGELIHGIAELLHADSLYAGAALLRQLVEVEYLAWAFSEDEEEAAAWLRSSPEERRRMWQPRHLRDRSGGRFRAADYGWHCELGGHPTPRATKLLPDHSARASAGFWWYDLTTHGVSIWEYVVGAAEPIGYSDVLKAPADEQALPAGIEEWRDLDPLRRATVEWADWRRSVAAQSRPVNPG